MQFEIRGEPENYLRITLDKVHGFPDSTCAFGGYDSESIIIIKSDNYSVRGVLYVSTGNIYEFYNEIQNCQQGLSGVAKFRSYEGNLWFNVEYDILGHINITGKYNERHQENNYLRFSFLTDQTFIKSTLDELRKIYEKFGNNKGKF